MTTFQTSHDAARAVLARCPELAILGTPDDRAWNGYDTGALLSTIASMLDSEYDSGEWDGLGPAVDLAVSVLAGEAGPTAPGVDLDPRKPADVLRVVENYRRLGVWCWLARWEAARRHAVDYLLLVAENDGDAYRADRAYVTAVRRAAYQVVNARKAVTAGADPDDLDVPAHILGRDDRAFHAAIEDATELLRKKWRCE